MRTPGDAVAAVLAVALVLGAPVAAKPTAPRSATRPSAAAAQTPKKETIVKVHKTEEEWAKILTPEQYRVLRKKGTEVAFTGKYWNNHVAGEYLCAACGLPLFRSDTKFESGTGWPSFWAPLAASHVEEHRDRSFGMVRTEVACARCDGHLGHVFDDGPAPTGLRYCMNSAALRFEPRK